MRVQANLNDRSQLEYPLNLGRNVLKQGFIVDCAQERILSSKCLEGVSQVKRPALWLAVAFFLVSFSLIGYRVFRLGYPLLPTSSVKAWGLTMEIFFEPTGRDGKEIEIRAGLPESRPGQTVIEQKDLSGSLQFNLLPEGLNQIGVWSGDPEEGRVISYRATVLLNPKRLAKPKPPGPESFPAIIADKSEQILARRLVERWRSLNASEKLKAIAATAKGVWRKAAAR